MADHIEEKNVGTIDPIPRHGRGHGPIAYRGCQPREHESIYGRKQIRMQHRPQLYRRTIHQTYRLMLLRN